MDVVREIDSSGKNILLILALKRGWVIMSRRVTRALHVFSVILLVSCPVRATPMLYDIYLDTPSPYRQPFEIDELLWMNSGLWSPFFSFASGFVAMTWDTGFWEEGGLMNRNLQEMLKP